MEKNYPTRKKAIELLFYTEFIMRSCAYSTGLDDEGEHKGERHTVLSVFDENGKFIRSLDLERQD